VKLKLTQDIEFSMTEFSKPNKGFTNQMKINCFMNVCMQSLLACPAFFNMLTAIAENPDIEAIFDEDGLLRKLVEVSRYFNERNQLDRGTNYAGSIVNGELIFEKFLQQFNPEMEQ
jgi:hypothetical protein